MTNTQIRKNEAAQRIIDIDPYSAWDYDETVESISEAIDNDPLTIIEYLLTVVEHYQA